MELLKTIEKEKGEQSGVEWSGVEWGGVDQSQEARGLIFLNGGGSCVNPI